MQDWINALDHTMPELLRQAAERYADQDYVIDEAGERLSFRDMERLSARCALGLLALGVGPGDGAAIWAPNGADWIVAACAIERIGAVMVPINTRFRGQEAAYLLEKSRAKILFSVSRFLENDYLALLAAAAGAAGDGRPFETLPDLAHVIVFDRPDDPRSTALWQDLLETREDEARLIAAEARVTPRSVCDVLFTSGTTGAPKGAMHSHGQALWMPGLWNAANDLRRHDRMVIINPFFHSFGYRSGWVSALLAGIVIFPIAVFDPLRTLELIQREQITVLMGPPTLFAALLDHPERSRFDLSSLRVGHTGSANVPVDLIRRAREELGFELFLTSYGLTEATALVSVCNGDDDFETISRTVGRPLPGVELKIVGGDGSPLPPDSPGELLVRGPNVMMGYLDDPEATTEAIDAEGFLHTGDVGLVTADGLLRIVDRLKDVVIVGGFNAYPAEIEAVLRTHPAIADVVVIGLPDERLGETCAACVILKPGAALNLQALSDWSRERLANFKAPRRLFLFEDFPRTPLGKVQKFAVRQEALSRLEAPSPQADPLGYASA
nr:AMP-binding protein [uncultured Brevundimonas sp.]